MRNRHRGWAKVARARLNDFISDDYTLDNESVGCGGLVGPQLAVGSVVTVVIGDFIEALVGHAEFSKSGKQGRFIGMGLGIRRSDIWFGRADVGESLPKDIRRDMKSGSDEQNGSSSIPWICGVTSRKNDRNTGRRRGGLF